MSIEVDLRNFLSGNTPAGLQVFYTTAPQQIGGQFITLNKLSDDGFHTTQIGPGRLTFSIIEATCSVKGTDQAAQYETCVALAEAVKATVNAITSWPYQMGNTVVYYVSIESVNEQAKSRGVFAPPYQYQEGKGSGIQRIVVPLAFNYWGANN